MEGVPEENPPPPLYPRGMEHSRFLDGPVYFSGRRTMSLKWMSAPSDWRLMVPFDWVQCLLGESHPNLACTEARCHATVYAPSRLLPMTNGEVDT